MEKYINNLKKYTNNLEQLDSLKVLLKKLDKYLYMSNPDEDVTVTPYGTIVIDFWNSHNLVSIEVGDDNDLGFFTEFEDGNDLSLDHGDIGEIIPLPELLIQAMDRLVNCNKQ